jgi:hypothetical protein
MMVRHSVDERGWRMQGPRLVNGSGQSPLAPCSRCQAAGCPWDRIGGHVICPDCQELLASGEGAPLAVPTREGECCVCRANGVVPYLTFPLHGREPLELGLCGRHFHALLGRRLDRYAYRVLGRRLQGIGLCARQVFLLHEAFYDERGHPLQPVRED